MSLYAHCSVADKIERINVVGNDLIQSSTIESYAKVQRGMEYSPSLKDQIITDLYATTMFNRINVKFDSGILKIIVNENLFISDVKFSGNRKIKKAMLEDEISSIVGTSLSENRLQSDVKTIKEMYQRMGRFNTKIVSKIEPLENNRVRVNFQIDEGPKTSIKRINFVGNKNYSDSELRSIISTKVSSWFSFLSRDDTYDPVRIESDKQLLQEFYHSVGFARFQVVSVVAELLPNKDAFVITYSIDEGEQYKLGEISLNNEVEGVKDKAIYDLIKIKTGEVFDVQRLRSAIDDISEKLDRDGMVLAQVSFDTKINDQNGLIDITFKIRNSNRQYINRINISGNLKTEDRVIRREVKIDEGDVVSKSKLEKTRRNIRNLDYFLDNFGFDVVGTQFPNQYDLNINVDEKSTSNIGLELGYDTYAGLFGRVSFVERNFAGTGVILNTAIKKAKKSVFYQFGMTDPKFRNSDFAVGFNIFRREDSKNSGFSRFDQKDYKSESTGLNLHVGYEVVEDLTHQIEYQIKRDELKTGKQSTSLLIREQEGKFVSSTISHSLIYDQLDSRILTKNGYMLTGSQSYTGVGGDDRFLKHEAIINWYKSFYNNRYTLNIRGAAGHMYPTGRKNIRIHDRFTLGGGENLRGFDVGGVGPRIKRTSTTPASVFDRELEGLGGQKYYSVTTELSTPVPLPEILPQDMNITFSVFLDIGSLWKVNTNTSEKFFDDRSMRASVGFGLLVVTPIAPIRMDWGFPIKKKPYDDVRRFSLRFTTGV